VIDVSAFLGHRTFHQENVSGYTPPAGRGQGWQNERSRRPPSSNSSAPRWRPTPQRGLNGRPRRS